MCVCVCSGVGFALQVSTSGNIHQNLHFIPVSVAVVNFQGHNNGGTNEGTVSLLFTSVEDGICILRKTHMCCTLSLRSFDSVATKTVPVFQCSSVPVFV